MSLKSILLLLISALYFFGAHWLYINKINGICCGDESTITTPGITTSPPDDNDIISDPIDNGMGSLGYLWSRSEPEVGDGFDDYRSAVLEGMTNDNTLEITGDYFADEITPEGFPTLGHARAAALRQLLKEDISEDRVIINGRLVEEEDGVRTDAFDAISYTWVDAVSEDESTVIEIEDRTLIFHPYNSSDRLEDEKILNYLSALAKRMEDSNETLIVTGHTDYNGDAASNRKLGLYRAQGVRDILVMKGVDRSRIKVRTRGEMYPAATNKTAVGRQKNRRTVIQIMGGSKEF